MGKIAYTVGDLIFKLSSKLSVKNKLPVVLIFLLIILFVGGFLVTRYLKQTGSTGTDNTVLDARLITEGKTAYTNTLNFTTSMAGPEPTSYPLDLTCGVNNTCMNGTVLEPPFQWLRYAQFGLAKQTGDNNLDMSGWLDDLFNYPAESFDWRLYQYGEMILTDPVKYAKYADQYLKVLATVRETPNPDVSTTSGEIDFYTAKNPGPTEIPAGYQQSDEPTTYVAIMKTSQDSMDLINAYMMTKDTKYLFNANGNLKYLHTILYYQPDISAGNDFKLGSCYTLLADATAYKADNDANYLAYSNYVLDEGILPRVLNDPALTQNTQVKQPMTLLSCVNAYEILIRADTSRTAQYQENITDLYTYIFTNYLDKEQFTGQNRILLLNGAGNVDVTSTQWLVYLIELTQERNDNSLFRSL